ncbi:uncharacterized protein M421DRAFT_424061 [Didymella exigua CBS 183.55]|uniref:Uncharacterized protein n=1 Tax=Didymella exigua CBS 183.55 TaxID=1150837 RepID=A0A6A5RCZ1_9PLEO|nr:uncharacterized protein M421DRAFT_424061 [Didymella exigua CBS 183.55]KAF1925259.1 hypothetical protein M421DRAFT_424061 [Didymella exigua CBS 183.55]
MMKVHMHGGGGGGGGGREEEEERRRKRGGGREEEEERRRKRGGGGGGGGEQGRRSGVVEPRRQQAQAMQEDKEGEGTAQEREDGADQSEVLARVQLLIDAHKDLLGLLGEHRGVLFRPRRLVATIAGCDIAEEVEEVGEEFVLQRLLDPESGMSSSLELWRV